MSTSEESTAPRSMIVDLKKPHTHLFSSPDAVSNFAHLAQSSDLGAEFAKVRGEAYAAVLVEGAPADTHELWRYTHASQLKPELAEIAVRTETQVGQEKLPTGVEILKGAAAFAALNQAQKFTLDTREAATLGSLCDATCSDITVVVVKPGVVVHEPLRLSALAQLENRCGSRMIGVVVGRGATATIIEDLSGTGKGLELERIELVLGAGARGNFVHIQEYGDDVRYYGRHRITAGRDVDFTTLHVALGARVARLDIDLMLPESGAAVNLLGISVVDGRRHVDFHPNQRHLAPHCRSDLFLKTVVKDKGRSVYYGYIKVAEGAQKTDAYQTNRNLVLSSNGRADTIPNLEIKANDVKCSHGASVTNVGVEDMFYLAARGLPPPVAERLLVGGFLEDVLGRFNDEQLRGVVSNRISARLDRTKG